MIYLDLSGSLVVTVNEVDDEPRGVVKVIDRWSCICTDCMEIVAILDEIRSKR